MEFGDKKPDEISELQRWILERVQRKEGSTAIFKEDRFFLALVQVTGIVGNAWGISCLITSVATPGLPSFDTTMISAAWDVFSGGDLTWHARQISWDLMFEEQLINEVRALGEAAAREGRILNSVEARQAIRDFSSREIRARMKKNQAQQ